MKKGLNKIFKELRGQSIQKFSVRGKIDQHFHLVTDKVDLKFGANDLGYWVEKYKELKSSGKII